MAVIVQDGVQVNPRSLVAVKPLVQGYRVVFQRGGEGDDLERGPDFVAVADHMVAPVRRRTQVGALGQKRRQAGHGQNFPGSRSDNHARGANGMTTRHGPAERALDNLLQPQVDGQDRVRAVSDGCVFRTAERQLIAGGVLAGIANPVCAGNQVVQTSFQSPPAGEQMTVGPRADKPQRGA